ncbi:MAG: ATP-binding protein [Planctomycetes bacterium]|nr:ATP-binding protein [Planctomycetota bacterium]
MIKRTLENFLLEDLKHFPAVGLLGPRQVGKTTLAKMLSSAVTPTIYMDLELETDLYRLQNAQLFLKQYADSLVIIDEIQRKPDLFPLLRALSDQTPDINGRFLILGSASPDLIKGASESLAGRIFYRELHPFSLFEVKNTKDAQSQLWLRGGYPDSFLAQDLAQSIKWREGFIRTYLERDIPQLGFSIPASQVRRFWTMLAHVNGQVLNASQLATSMGISSPTIRRYIDLLSDTFVIRQLQPWYANIKKRLVKSPKIYLKDTGLLHRLVQIDSFDALHAHPALGASWEGFCIEQILAVLPFTVQSFYFRTATGNEVDLVLTDLDNRGPVCVEFKYSLTPRVSKGFYISMEDMGAARGYVVYPGDEIIPLPGNVSVYPLRKFIEDCILSL